MFVFHGRKVLLVICFQPRTVARTTHGVDANVTVVMNVGEVTIRATTVVISHLPNFAVNVYTMEEDTGKDSYIFTIYILFVQDCFISIVKCA